METRPVYLALGSNLGDRKENIRRAVELLDERFQTPHARLSGLYETAADGFDGPAFINAAVRYDLSLEPLEILRICKSVESEMGRPQTGIELDAQGRILLPQNLRDWAELKKDVTVVGCNNHIELWNSASWAEIFALETTPENIASVMEELEF